MYVHGMKVLDCTLGRYVQNTRMLSRQDVSTCVLVQFDIVGCNVNKNSTIHIRPLMKKMSWRTDKLSEELGVPPQSIREAYAQIHKNNL